MFRNLSERRAAARSSGKRRTRRCPPEVDSLEGRSLLSTVPIISESVAPQTLWPPNGRFVPVHVSGTISDPGPNVINSVQYNVDDSEAGGQILRGPVALVNGAYSFDVPLQARRAGYDFNGRQYTINIIAADTAGNVNEVSAVVIVPHDQGHRSIGPPVREHPGHLRRVRSGNSIGTSPGNLPGLRHRHSNPQNEGPGNGNGAMHGHGAGNGLGQGGNGVGHTQGNGMSHGNGNHGKP